VKLKGLYRVTDDSLPPREKFLEFIESAIEGGLDLIQLRLKKAEREDIISLGKELRLITKRQGIPLFVNDDPEIAFEIEADGVHLGREDPPVREVIKKFGSSLLVGASAYGDLKLAERLVEEGADYVAFGNFFKSPTKPDEETVPLEILQRAKELINVSIFGIGGITKENAHLVLEKGADGIAVVSAIFAQKTAEEVKRATEGLKKIVESYITN
jgi:thiamine-phosphate pyrophosphorylase